MGGEALKKRHVTVAIIAIVLVGACVFLLVAKGSVRERDGLMQHSRIYIKNAYVQDGVLFYTITNNSLREYRYNSYQYVQIQQWIDGAWRSPYPAETDQSNQNDSALGSANHSRVTVISPFTASNRSMPLDNEYINAPGDYRIVLRNLSDDLFIVGYYTIPE